MDAVGLSETRDLLQRVVVGLAQELPALDEPIRRACAEGYRRVQDQIPEDTGALKASLTRYRDRAQVFSVTADGYEFGSSLPQAIHQANRIPPPDDEPLLEALARAVDDLVEGS
jgi:hypothetical protein